MKYLSWLLLIFGVASFVLLYIPSLHTAWTIISAIACFFLGLWLFNYARSELAHHRFRVPVSNVNSPLIGYIILFWSVVVTIASVVALGVILFW